MGGLTLSTIIESPEPLGHRNKCEFTFGCDSKNEKSLGFRISSFRDGVRVENPEECPNVPKAMKVVVNKIIEFIKASPFEVYDLKSHRGVWRNLFLRYSKRSKEMLMMFVVSLDSIEVKAWQNECDRLKSALISLQRFDGIDNEVFRLESGEEICYTSEDTGESGNLISGITYQNYDGASVPPSDHPIHILYGRDYITEKMLDCEFKISPIAFFQVCNVAKFMTMLLFFSRTLSSLSSSPR
mgnify:CR=1 FL=1